MKEKKTHIYSRQRTETIQNIGLTVICHSLRERTNGRGNIKTKYREKKTRLFIYKQECKDGTNKRNI